MALYSKCLYINILAQSNGHPSGCSDMVPAEMLDSDSLNLNEEIKTNEQANKKTRLNWCNLEWEYENIF